MTPQLTIIHKSPWVHLRQVYSEVNADQPDSLKPHLHALEAVTRALAQIAPRLLTDSEFAALDEANYTRLIKELNKASDSQKETQFHVRLLNEGLEWGEEKLKWKIPPLARVFRYPLPPSAFSGDSFFLATEYLELRQAFESDLEDTPSLPTLKLRRGRMLLAAILYSALLDKKWWDPFLAACRQPGLIANYSFLALEIKHAVSFRGAANEGMHVWTEIMRWPLCQLAELILYDWHFRYPGDFQSRKPFKAKACLAAYLNHLCSDNPWTQNDFADLIQASRASWCISGTPPFLMQWASGLLSSTTATEPSLITMLTGRIVQEQSKPIAQSEPLGEARQEFRKIRQLPQLSAPIEDLARQDEFYKTFLNALYMHGERTDKYETSSTQVASFIKVNERELSPWLLLLAAWAQNLISGSSETKGKHAKSDPQQDEDRELFTVGENPLPRIKPVSARRYIQSFGRALIAECGDIPPKQMKGEEFEDLYLDIVSFHVTQKEQYVCAHVLHRFHRFLVQTYGVEPADFSEIYSFAGSQIIGVRSQLITPGQFDTICRILGNNSPNQGRDRKIPLIIALLAFRCGLRRSEMRHLRLADILGREFPVILVRQNYYASLKSSSSRRIIPVRELLEADEFAMFVDWYRMRLSEEMGTSGQALLLCEKGNESTPLKMDPWFSLVVTVLRTVTNDPRMVLHHARHSFANWTLIRLLVLPEKLPLPIFDHPSFSRSRCREFRTGLLGSDSTGQKALFELARLLGHSSHTVTFRHYIHIMDLLLYGFLQNDQTPPNPSIVAMGFLANLQEKSLYPYKTNKGWDWNRLLKSVRKRNHVHKVLTKSPPMQDIPSHFTIAFPIDGMAKPEMEIYDWRLIFSVVRDLEARITHQTISRRHGIAIATIKQWQQTVNELKNRGGHSPKRPKTSPTVREPGQKLKTSHNRKTHPTFFTQPHSKYFAFIDHIFKTFPAATEVNPALLSLGIRKILATSMAASCNPRFTDVHSACEYLAFLSLLGIPNDYIFIKLHAPQGISSPESPDLIKYWADQLALPKDQIVISNRNPGKKPFGSAEIIVGKPNKERKIEGIYAFRFSIYLIIIATHTKIIFDLSK